MPSMSKPIVGTSRNWLAAMTAGLALVGAACGDGRNATLTGPSSALSEPMGAQPGGGGGPETLPLPVPVPNTSTCESVTIQWANSPTPSGKTAQIWQVQVSGTNATNFDAPLSYDNPQHSTNSLTLSLDPGTYLVRVRAKSNEPQVNNSAFSVIVTFTVTACTTGCTFTQGYWKNHLSDWPVDSLTLGSVSYSSAQLLSIFGEPVAGNGLISLAHQLIAAKLNVANGASDAAIASTIAAADALIDSLQVPPVGAGYLEPSTTSGLTTTLDNYNKGIIGPGHCE
jgi:hypothetical protein